jgi:hypothetical protein
MSIPTTTISSTLVKVTWTEPNDHSSAITEYDIQFLKSDSTFTSITASCNGATPTIRDQHYCEVDMTDIRTATGLTLGTLIQVKARAKNVKGWGAYSQLNTVGVTI